MAEDKKKGLKREPATGAGTGYTGRNHLLVIAIDEYAHCPKLNNCVKDAQEFIEVLTGKYQFDPEYITTLYNAEATRANILARLNEQKQKVQPEDNLVIYFSGHGETEDDVGYWVPVAAHPENNWEFISTYDIKSRLDPIPSFHTFVIVDACFSGSLFAAYKTVKAGYETKRSRLGLAASHSRERALDGTAGENSPFAATLLKKLRESPEDLSVQRLATEVIEEVQGATRGRQTPVFKPLDVKGDDSGQYVFHRKANEAGDWAVCQKADTLVGYQAFLAKYPGSIHVEAARRRVGELEEEGAWAAAKKGDTILSYYQYNQRYPAGKHRQEALDAIKKLEEEQSWQQAVRSNTLSALLEYKDRYPQGRFAPEADEKIEAILASQQEPMAWQAAKATDTVTAYEAYLRQYPQGPHALEAQTAVQELNRKAEAAEQEKQEEEAWRSAAAADTESGYQHYLQTYPQGRYASEAETALAELRERRGEAEAARRQKEQEADERKRREQTRQQTETAWTTAKQTGTIIAVKGFLREYPGAPQAAEARALLQRLQGARRQEQWQWVRKRLPVAAGLMLIIVVIWGITQWSGNTTPENSGDLSAGLDTSATQTTDDTLLKEPEPIPSGGQPSSEETAAPSSPPSLKHEWPGGDKLVVNVSAGSPPYRLKLLRNGQEKYNQTIPAAGSRTIALAEYRKAPGDYEILVEDSQGQKASQPITIDPPRFEQYMDSGLILEERSRRLYIVTKGDPTFYCTNEEFVEVILSKEEMAALIELANILIANPELRIIIEGIQGNQPISNRSRYETLFEATYQEALLIKETLIGEGVSSASLKISILPFDSEKLEICEPEFKYVKNEVRISPNN